MWTPKQHQLCLVFLDLKKKKKIIDNPVSAQQHRYISFVIIGSHIYRCQAVAIVNLSEIIVLSGFLVSQEYECNIPANPAICISFIQITFHTEKVPRVESTIKCPVCRI